MLADELLLTARLPFVAETTIHYELILVEIIPHFSQTLQRVPDKLVFSQVDFTASQVRSAFIKHIVEWLERQPQEEALARAARVMSQIGS